MQILNILLYHFFTHQFSRNQIMITPLTTETEVLFLFGEEGSGMDHSMWDCGSPTRYQTQTPCIGSTEA